MDRMVTSMNPLASRPPWPSCLFLAPWLAVPSFGFIQEHAGTGWVLLHLLFVALSLVFVPRFLMPIEGWLTRHFLPLCIGSGLLLFALHFTVHPYEDLRGAGRSSDRDEALEIAVGRLLSGENPYYPQNPNAGPLSVLPGGILLALPFVIAGKVGWINVVAITLLMWVLHRYGRSSRDILTVTLLAWFASAAGAYEFVSGGDLIANGIYVALGFLWVWKEWSATHLRRATAFASALFLGVAVASRANFPLLCPLMIAALWKQAGWQRAGGFAAITGLSSVSLIAGFYLIDPAAFTPLLSRGKLAAGDASGWTSTFLAGFTLALVAACSFRLIFSKSIALPRTLFSCCALVLAAPVVGVLLMDSLRVGSLHLGFLSDRFGLMWIPFALFGSDGEKRETGKQEPDQA